MAARVPRAMLLRLALVSVVLLFDTAEARPIRARPHSALRATGGSRSGGARGSKASWGGLHVLEWVPSQQVLVTASKMAWNGVWRAMMSELAPQSPEGDYVRPAPQRGSRAPDGGWPPDLPAVGGRYHLYTGNPCPWCHRALIVASLRGQVHADGVTFTRLLDDPERASRGGWYLHRSGKGPGGEQQKDLPPHAVTLARGMCTDPLFDAPDLRHVYDGLTPGGVYAGRCTAPLLVDRGQRGMVPGTNTGAGRGPRIISNESGDIVRMLGALDLLPDPSGSPDAPAPGMAVDLYPPELRDAIDESNGWIYDLVNNGVYRAGFATTQEAYERAELDVHTGLERLDALLEIQPFVAGEVFTEADARLLPTAVRFDAVYATLFRCGRRRIRPDYPHIGAWMRRVLSLHGEGGAPLSATFDLEGAKRSYYKSLFPLNPGGIVPRSPDAVDASADANGAAFGVSAASAGELPVDVAGERHVFAWRERRSTMGGPAARLAARRRRTGCA